MHAGETVIFKHMRSYVDRHIRAFVAVLVVITIVVWGVSAVIQPFRDWILRNSIFNVLILVLLGDMLARLVELKSPSPHSVSVFENEPRASPALLEFIEKRRPAKVDLIEYSTATIHDLLEALKSSGCAIRLLICDPEHAVTNFQRDRINDRVRDLLTLTFRDYRNIEIRMYALPASIRGRLVDDRYVTVGWHTHTAHETGLVGHTNPMVSGVTTSDEGQALKTMFDHAFEELWTAPSTKTLLSPGPRVEVSALSNQEMKTAISESVGDIREKPQSYQSDQK